VHRGVHIHRVWSSSLGKASLLHRGADALSFQAGALQTLLRLPRPDVVLAKTSPPLVASLGWAAAQRHRARLLYWVQDLYPDVAVALGAVDVASPLARVASVVGDQLARRSDALVALGPRMQDALVRHGAPPQRVHIIDNWADTTVVQPLDHEQNTLRRAWNLQGRKAVMYSGNFGLAHDFDTLQAALLRLARREDVSLMMVGDGSKKADVQRALQGQGGDVRFLPLFPREDLGLSLTAADVHLVSLHPAMDGLVVPSKIYGVLAAGRPSVYVGPRNSDVWRLVQDARAGLCVENGDVDGLVDAVVKLVTDDALRAELGRNAHAASTARYDRTHALGRFDALLSTLGA
jgi:glycosyltransferase involved in cell wall biosynthesis